MNLILIILMSILSFSSFAIDKQTLEIKSAKVSIDTMETGYKIVVDGVIAKPMTELVIEKIIEITGEKRFVDYKCDVKSVNFYENKSGALSSPKTAMLLSIENCVVEK
jgi:hypothetical protein